MIQDAQMESRRALMTHYALPLDLAGMHVVNYAPGQWVTVEGQPIDQLLLVLSGRAKVCLFSENGRCLLLCFYHAGGMIGDLELLRGDPAASCSVQAVTPFSCVSVPLGPNRARLLQDNAFLRRAGAALAGKLDRGSRNAASNLLYPLESRLCSYLDAMTDGDIWREPLTETAELLGVSYRHLLRALNALREGGLIEKVASGHRLLNRGALREKGRGFYDLIER